MFILNWDRYKPKFYLPWGLKNSYIDSLFFSSVRLFYSVQYLQIETAKDGYQATNTQRDLQKQW